MADLRDVASDVVYRPLSGLALAGFAVSCLFGGAVVVSALMGIIQGAAFFFPDWTLLVPLGGFLVAWMGLNDVRNSEGTKAGSKLATYGMWISLITGGGYFAYSNATRLALRQQAMAFFLTSEVDSGFLTRLQNAAKDKVEFNRAFLLTLPAHQRSGMRAEDEAKLARLFDTPDKDDQPGQLTRFRDDSLVRGITKGGAATVVEPLGVQSWKYEKRSYQVTCKFRIAMLEAVIEVAMTARSSEGEDEGQSRKWFVDMTANRLEALKKTPLGEGLTHLRTHAGSFVQSLETFLRDKRGKLPDFAELDATDWSKFDAAVQANLKARVAAIWNGADISDSWHFKAQQETSMTDWDRDTQGRVTLTMPFTIIFMSKQGQFADSLESLAVVQTRAAVEPEKIAAEENTVMPDWELKRFKAIRVRQPKK